MPEQPLTLADLAQHGLTLVRQWLGTSNLEATMATVVEALESLAAQQAEVSAAQATSFDNLQGAVERLEQAVRDGEVSPEIQSAVDELTAGFTAMKDAATAADDGVEQPTEPTPGEPNPTEPVNPI